MRCLFFLPILLAAAPAPDAGRALLDAIHSGDLRAVRSALKAGVDPNARDEMGATALMHAGAYASEECMRALIAAGANVNAASNAGFTPLMWSVSDPAKVRLLLSRRADPTAKTKDGHSALILARQNGFREAVPPLLAAGAADEDGMDTVGRPVLKLPADTLLEMRSLGSEPMHLTPALTPLLAISYSTAVPAEPVREMLDLGADPNALGSIVTLKLPPLAAAAYFGHLNIVRLLLERGADPNLKGSRGLTPLMAAAASENRDPAVVQALLEKKAGINARDDEGRTALDWALLLGDSAIVRHLRQAGGREMAPASAPPPPVPQPRAARDAMQKALAILQPASPAFFKQTGCISCHSNSLPSIAATRARDRGVAVDADLSAHPSKAAMAMWTPLQENLAVGASSVPGLIANVSFELTAMAEEAFPRNFVTDAAAAGIARLQRGNGSWNIADVRQPLGGRETLWTALAVRSLQAYMPKGLSAEKEMRIRRARTFFLEARPGDTQGAAFVLLGLRWTGAPAASIATQRERVRGLQREDGGWGQLPAMPSDAYATGQALYALQTGGAMPPSDAAYQRGVQFLLRTQLPDGSWFVRSRGLAFQPYTETGFPHGKNQFISSAATSWAVIALSAALVQPKQVALR